MRNLKRVLAMALTIFMVIGTIPIAGFAVEAKSQSYTGSVYTGELDYVLPGEESFRPKYITDTYASDPSYWIPVYKAFDDFGNYVSNFTPAVYEGNLSTASYNDTITTDTDEAGNYIVFNKDHRVSFFGSQNGALGTSNIVEKDLAGLDIAVDMNIRMAEGATVGQKREIKHNQIIDASNQWGVAYLLVEVTQGDNGLIYGLYIYDAGNTGSKTKIAELSVTDYTNVKLVFDFGGTSCDYHVYVNGRYAGSAAYNKQANMDMITISQDGDYGKGVAVGGYQCSGDATIHVNKYNIFYYDSDKDGTVTDEVRGCNVKIAGVPDFESIEDTDNWQKITLNKLRGKGNYDAVKGTVTTGASETFLSPASNERADVKEELFYKNYAGLDVAIDLSLNIAENAATDSNILISTWTPSGSSGDLKSGWQHGLAILMPISETQYGLYWPKDGDNGSSGGAAVKDMYGNPIVVNKGTAIDITFYLDVNRTTGESYSIFVNRKYCGNRPIFSKNSSGYTSINDMQIIHQNSWDTAGKYAHGYIFGGIRLNKVDDKTVAAASGTANAYYFTAGQAVTKTTPERKTDFPFNGDNKLIHYNDFNDESLTGLSGQLYAGGGKIHFKEWVDDDNGGKALHLTDTRTNTEEALGAGNGYNDPYYQVTPGDKTRKSFVMSASYKKFADSSNNTTSLFGMNIATGVIGSYVNGYNIDLLYINGKGDIYLARMSKNTSGDKVAKTSAEGYTSGAVINGWLEAELASMTTAEPDNYIGKLYKDEFTNIAVAVDFVGNTYDIYINGVLVKENLQLLTDYDKKVLEDTKGTSYGINYRRGTIDFSTHMYVDNWAMYWGDELLNPNNDPLNGIVNVGENSYLYKNGVRCNDDIVGEDGKKDYYVGGKEVTLNEKLASLPSGATFVADEADDWSELDVAFATDIIIDLNGQTKAVRSLNITNEKAIIKNGTIKLQEGEKIAYDIETARTDGAVFIAKSSTEYLATTVSQQEKIPERLDQTTRYAHVFRPTIGDLNTNQTMFGNGSDAADIQLIVEVYDENGEQLRSTNGSKSWVYSDELFKSVYANGKAFKFTVDLGTHTGVTVKYFFVSGTGMKTQISSTVIGDIE